MIINDGDDRNRLNMFNLLNVRIISDRALTGFDKVHVSM